MRGQAARRNVTFLAHRVDHAGRRGATTPRAPPAGGANLLSPFADSRRLMGMNTHDFSSLSDAQLLQRSRNGDREAFGRIVERYQSLICSLAYSACGNLARSEDLAQETFISAWQALPDLREPAKLSAWLGAIVRNHAASAHRREQRRGGAPAPLESVNVLTPPEADPAARAVTSQEADLLWRSLAALPDTYREPMVLFYRQGQSVADVARAARSRRRHGQAAAVTRALDAA